MLSGTDIQESEVAIFAVGIDVEQRERFSGKKIIEVEVQAAIKNPKAVFEKLDG